MKSLNAVPIVSILLVLIGFHDPVLLGQYHEEFNSQEPSWTRRETDCVILESDWLQRRSIETTTGNRFEKIVFTTGIGSSVYVCHDIPPAFLINEFNPSIRIKSSRPGISVMVRVVLPETPSPTGVGPMTTLLSGPVYRATGQWQDLNFSSEQPNLQTKLRDEVWLLRRQFGGHVSANNAFIDKIVLNLYCGEGETVVQIDDLKVDGLVDAKEVAASPHAQSNFQHDSQVRTVGHVEMDQDPVVVATNNRQPSLVVRDGTVLLVEQRPFMPRIIQHHGEPFEFLKGLGFNVIELKATATYEQLQSARQLDLWLVCPPPSTVGLAPIDFSFDRVLAWSVGNELTGRQLENVQQQIREIRESDQRDGRPIVANSGSHWMRYAQMVDILSVGIEPIGTSFLASQYSDWLKQRSQTIQHNNPVWADIQTDFPFALTNQIRAIAAAVPPTPIEPQQMKFLVYEAISGGARGLRFKSRSRLDGTDPTTRLRAMTIEWLNTEILRLEPWIAGGALRDPIVTGNPALEVNVLSTNRSRLLLVQRPTHHEQYLAGDTPVQTVSIQDTDTTFSDRAMLITETGLLPLTIARNYGGNQIQIEQCPYAAAIVLTQDPTVTNRLSQTYQRPAGASTIQMHVDLTRQWLAIMQLIQGQLDTMGRGSENANLAMRQAGDAFQNYNRLIQANSQGSASVFLDQTDERLAFVRQTAITEPLGLFQSKTSSPLLSHISLIPLHWELASRLGSSRWNPNGLPAGDFEDLNHLTNSGWINRRLDEDRVSTRVELTEAARVDGRFGLQLSVASTTNAATIDATPLWLVTPKIPVKVGQIVRIHGWVNVPQVIRGNMDGLMIIDSIGGEATAERIPITSGWQEFTLYRSVPHETDLEVTFAMTGFGVAMLDEVTIRTVDLPPSGQQAQLPSRQ